MQTKAKFEESKNKETRNAEDLAFNILEWLGYQCKDAVLMMEPKVKKNETINEKKNSTVQNK